jgi:hypothetical protein
VPNINESFPSNYLKASDLKGVSAIVTIDHVGFEPVGRNREMKAVVFFKGKEKGLVLNKTNATKITQLAGSPHTEDWEGTRLLLYGTETEFAGETVECIRIKPAPIVQQRQPVPATGPAAPAPPDPEPEPQVVEADDIPF